MDTRTQANFELAMARTIVGAVVESTTQTAEGLCEAARMSGIAPDRCMSVITKLVNIGVLTNTGFLKADKEMAIERGLL